MKESYILSETHSSCAWLAPPAVLKLQEDEVHVWRASLSISAPQANALWNILSPEETGRADCFHFRKNREEFIAARGILRLILGTYLGVDPAELRFCSGTYGKPSLCGETGGGELRFNLSHSHDLALYAVSRRIELGIDLEHIHSDLQAGSVAGELFSQRELAELNVLPEDARPAAFFTLWTRKEACLKARGSGLSLDAKQFNVLTDHTDMTGSQTAFDEGRGNSSWTLRNLNAGPGYAAAIAVQRHDWQLKCWQWP